MTSSSSGTLSPEEAKRILSDGRLEVFRWEDDDITQRFAAEQARLPYDRLTTQEAGCFPDIILTRKSCQLYLFIRNKLLHTWFLEPSVELTAQDAYQQIIVPYNSDKSLVYRIHGFLQRYGYINFGIFHRLRNTPSYLPAYRKKVIVIGGGISGIAAARQLLYFGMNVVLLEAKNTCGGRTLTYGICAEDKREFVDLGASHMSGVKGNPLTVLMKQIDCQPFEVNCECPLYDDTGKQIEASKERLVNEAFKKLLHLNGYMQHDKNILKADGTEFSLEETCMNLLDILELKMQKKREEFWNLFEEILGKMMTVQQEITIYSRVVEDLVSRPKLEFDKNDEDDASRYPAEIDARCRNRDLSDAIKRMENAMERYNNLEATLRDMKRQEPSDCYMNARDKKLMDFHMAIFEGKFGAPLSELSAKHYNHSLKYFQDKHCVGFKEGFGTVILRFLAGLDPYIKNDAEVTSVDYTPSGVSVKYKSVTKPGEIFEEKGDCVVCTVPLGVLKKSVDNGKDVLKFNPPLPQTTVDAVKKTGFGAFNKIVLLFERCFWNSENQFFGHLNKQRHDRGEMYLFCSRPNSLALTALMSGHSAKLQVPNHVILKRCMSTLQKIFGVNIPQPLECVITRWDEDALSLGSFSYLPPGTDDLLFDTLSQSVQGMNEKGERVSQPRIFFAGEHTYREFHATVQGAWLSGVREAAKVADEYLGCPFSRQSNPECVELDSDEDLQEENVDSEQQLTEDGDYDRNPIRPHTVGTLRLATHTISIAPPPENGNEKDRQQ